MTESDVPPKVENNETCEASLRDRLTPRLKLVGGAIASIAAIGAVASGLLGYWNVWKTVRSDLLSAARAPAPSAPTAPVTISKGPTVAVLPFANETGDPAQEGFADGVTQETIAALAKFGALRVLGRSVTGAYKGHVADSADLARQIGADYVVDGDLRNGGDFTRITVRLADAHTGAQVWSKAFDAKAGTDNFLSAQNEIGGRAAAIIGNFNTGIALAEFQRIQSKSLDQLTPYECIVEGVSVTSTTLLEEPFKRGRACLETLVAKEPANAAAWAALSFVYYNQRIYGVALPAEEADNTEKRAYLADATLRAASEAVDLAPNDAFVRRSLANAYRLSCRADRVKTEAGRAIELNPNEPQTYGAMGVAIAFLGDWDAGAAMADKGIEMIAPANPRWWWYAAANRHWMRGEYQQAYEALQKAYVERNWLPHVMLAYTLPFLGRLDEAKAEVATVRRLKPGYTIRDADAHYRLWCIDSAFREKMTDTLRRAGLPE